MGLQLLTALEPVDGDPAHSMGRWVNGKASQGHTKPHGEHPGSDAVVLCDLEQVTYPL